MHRLFFILVLLPAFVFGQKYTVSGYVRDKNSGEDMPAANVYVKELSKGTTTNTYGFFSLSLPKGEYTLQVSYIGYNDFSKKIVLDKDLKLNISVASSAILTKEVVVSSERQDKNVESIEISTVKMPVEQIKSLPAFLGEVDILKAIQLLPGVQSSGEGNTGFYVRGGGPDQNLIILDDAVVWAKKYDLILRLNNSGCFDRNKYLPAIDNGSLIFF